MPLSQAGVMPGGICALICASAEPGARLASAVQNAMSRSLRMTDPSITLVSIAAPPFNCHSPPESHPIAASAAPPRKCLCNGAVVLRQRPCSRMNHDECLHSDVGVRGHAVDR